MIAPPNMFASGDLENGFLDVAANMLAVMILVTMVVLVVSAPPVLRGSEEAQASPELPFPTPLWGSFPPHSEYWFVTDAGITLLDLNEIAQHIAEGDLSPETGLAQSYFHNERRYYRDLNDYRLEVAPDIEALRQSALALDAPQDIAAGFADRFEQFSIAPTFIVDEAGFEAFAEFYAHLRQTTAPLRWFSYQDGRAIPFHRNTDVFERRIRSWQ